MQKSVECTIIVRRAPRERFEMRAFHLWKFCTKKFKGNLRKNFTTKARRRATRRMEVQAPKIVRAVRLNTGGDPLLKFERAVRNLGQEWTNLEALFIHIPKCGGTSVNSLFQAHGGAVIYSLDSFTERLHLLPRNGPRLLTLDHLQTDILVSSGLISARTLEAVKSFSIVRNPYTRAVSSFRQHVKMGVIKPSMSFSSYMDFVERQQWDTDRWNVFGLSHANPVRHWLKPKLWRGPNTVLKLEQPQEIEEFLSGVTNADIKLAHLNENRRTPTPPLDAAARYSIERVYRDDFSISDYPMSIAARLGPK